MYIEQVLFIVAVICLLIAIGITLYIVKLKNKSNIYKKIINESTETFDAFTKTLSILAKTNPSNSNEKETDFIAGTMTEYVWISIYE